MTAGELERSNKSAEFRDTGVMDARRVLFSLQKQKTSEPLNLSYLLYSTYTRIPPT